MSYLVIARKYRPQKFSEIIGQEHITRTLENAIKLGKISHAYLFAGPRGIGKTSTARILAKAVNCKDRKGEEPCNQCTVCKEITRSESIDVIEIDAASNRGIDEIRELRKNVKFAPSSAKYKVYIIDEVHMLTKEAFNAILKTLEEPPSHVIFIMATTEPEKVLDTVSSRCQIFNFKLIAENKIKETLQNIAEEEKVEYEEEGLWTIARAAGGSIRDSQSIMDQALSYSSGKIVSKQVNELLGLIPREFLFSYTDCIKRMDVKEALKLTDQLLKEGYNLNRLFNDLLMHFRNIMFAKVFGKATGFMGFDKTYSIKLAEVAEGFSKEQLVWITEFLTINSNRMKYTDNPQVVMDTILFKLCQKYVSFDDILEVAGHGKALESSGMEEDIKKNELQNESKVEEEVSKKKEDYIQATEIFKEGSKWEKILGLIKKESQPLYHSLKDSKAALNKKKRKIIIRYAGSLDLTERQKGILNNNIKEVMGEEYNLEIKKIENTAASSEVESKPVKERQVITPAQIEEDEPVVGEIVSLFKGKIEKQHGE